MFRGGKVDSRGTGITSGLSYGGRVGLQGGGMPPTGSTFNINMGGRTPIPTGSNIFRPPAVIQSTPTGMSLLERARNIPYLGKLIPAAGGRLAAASPFGLAALGGMAIGKTADFITRATDTPEAYAFRKEETRANPFLFDETSTDEFIEFSEKLRDKDQGEKLGFFPRGGPEKRLEEMGLTGTYDPKSGERLENPLGDKNEEKALSADQLRILELEKLIEGMTKVEPKAKDTDTEESVEIDKEKFAKILGKDKARGQDIADMLLSFSSKALAPEATVKSAFAEFAADEVKRPSRVRKIDDSAAALAINKYIKGEISRAEADQYIKRIELTQKLRDESNVKTAAEYIQAADEAGFVKKVKVGLNSYYAQEGIVPKYEVVKSKDMDNPEKFKFSQDDVGVIFIEEDTREVYTFDSTGKKQPIINM